MEPATASVFLIRVLRIVFERMGMDAGALFQAAGVPDGPDDPDARVPVDAFYRVFEIAPRQTGDDAFGLHAAEALRDGDYGVLELVIRSAPSVGEALGRFVQYYPLLLREAIDMSLETVGGEVTLVHRRTSIQSSRQDSEMLLASIVLRAEAMSGVRMPVRRVRFAHPEPKDVSEHARIFRAPIEFDDKADALVFDAAYLAQPLRTADTAVSEVTRRYADLLMSEITTGDPWLDSVRRAIAETLRDGPTLPSIAKRIASTPRTLQRRLRDQGTTLSEVIDDVRRGMAERYLGRSEVAIAEVAYLLGFSEQSTFQRAFKRWTGLTPGDFRASKK